MQSLDQSNTLQADNCLDQKVYTYLSFCVILYCIAIRIYYYIQSKFLWQDEAWLFFSLYKADFLNVLTQKNIFFQTYPSLFGIISWAIINVFGVSTYALRLLPFIGSCLYFVLLYLVALRIKNAKYALICLAISAFNIILLNYCDEFKQYSLEACVTLVLLLFYLNNNKLTYIPYKYIALSIFSILFSVPAPFVVFAIILCFFFNYIRERGYEKWPLTIVNFLSDNFFKLLFLLFFSFIYYYFCLRNGDANNGNAWESGMIPYEYTKLFEWLHNNFFVILSRLMSNSHRVFEGSIFLFFACTGIFLITKTNNAFSMFIKTFIPIFVVSLCHIYSLGNILWGTQGARLSIYVLPVMILSSGYFVYYILNEATCMQKMAIKLAETAIFRQLANKILSLNKPYNNLLINISFVIFCVYLSIFTIICMNEWHYNDCDSYNNAIEVLKQNKHNAIISHSSIWYSVKYYEIYKMCNFKIEKLGNQITPNSEYPPVSLAFTSGFLCYWGKASKNRKIVVLVQQFFKNNVYRFIDKCGFSIEIYNFGEFYILVCIKK